MPRRVFINSRQTLLNRCSCGAKGVRCFNPAQWVLLTDNHIKWLTYTRSATPESRDQNAKWNFKDKCEDKEKGFAYYTGEVYCK